MQITYKKEVEIYTINFAEPESAEINRPDVVYKLLDGSFNPIEERLILLTLDSSNKVIKKYTIAIGAYNAVMADPVSILRPAILDNSRKIILSHNHPSGNSSFSDEDIIFTKKIINASKIMGVQLLDHVLYYNTGYKSMREYNADIF